MPSTEQQPLSDSSAQPSPTFWRRLKRTLLGGQRNPFDPRIFHNISLIAFFAWVGMGADGVSSANYGPEEAYHALRGFTFLTPLLAGLIAATVLIISAAYSQLIEQFPTGGGGYLVASKLIHPRAGVVAGAALVIDYVLTIAVSIVSGVHAVYSLLPAEWAGTRSLVAVAAVILLVFMNLRGVKESIIALLPIFMIFVVTHVFLVGFGVITHLHDLPARAGASYAQANQTIARDGMWFIILRLLHAFSMGAGTLTGIEAVSNGMLSLKEPRVQTGKRTMAYMAASLAFLAAFLLLNYFLFDIRPVEGKTLNSVLFGQIMQGWMFGGFKIGNIILWVMLLSASLLLFVAAQTGFIGGPRVLANMAEDSWLPHRFSHLSERLVTQNGILLMGAAAIAFILYARGNLTTLIAIYAINVFIGFALALAGMSRLWFSRRKSFGNWLRKFMICGTGFIVSAVMLLIMVAIKFSRGGWFILLVTAAFVALCFYIRRHYEEVESKTRRLDEILANLPFGDEPVTKQPLDSTAPTAVVLVQRYGGQGVHVLLNIHRLFGPRFKQYLFVCVGAIDSGHFKGADELVELRKDIEKETDKYVTLARSYGFIAEARTSCAIDYLSEIERLCLDIHREYPNSVYFTGRLLFWRDTIFSRLLHNETPLTLQRRLMFHGLQFVVLPIRLQ